MNLYDNLWVQKYRPKKLDDLILSEDNKGFFSKITEDTPHLLLYGPAGTGKTTLAKIIVNDILKCQYLYINASDENGVDTIRNKVTTFSQTRSIDGKKKVIILDEFCGTTPEAQRVLRNVMEEYASTTRFILTANYINRIIEPIQSRCLLFNIIPNLEQVALRCFKILKQENIKIESEEILIQYVKNNFPDIRRIVNDLQKFSVTGILKINQTDKVKEYSKNVLNLLIEKKPVLDIRKFLIQEERNFASDYHLLLKELFDLIFESNLKEDHKKAAMLEIGEHMYRDNFVMDHEINCFCCILNLSKIFSNS
jgi:DNA polymerase III delta prime subunit